MQPDPSLSPAGPSDRPLALIRRGRFWRPLAGRLSRTAALVLAWAIALGAVFSPLLIALFAAGVALVVKAVVR